MPHYLRRGASEIVLASSHEQEVLSHLACPSVVSRNVVLHQTVQQYDVDVEWQAVQHYLRRSASEVVLVSSQKQVSNLVRPGVVSRDVVSPDLVLPSVGLSRIRRSRCFRGCLACP